MPAWPGGPCPECGEDMPPNLVHCQICRALLNPELDPDSIEMPAFRPLQEIASMVEVVPRGYYVECPRCRQELRINRKYMGSRVQCKICSTSFVLEDLGETIRALGFYASCPHCNKELRAAVKYVGSVAACKFCDGHIRFVEHAVH